jgi:hypothetical protein
MSEEATTSTAMFANEFLKHYLKNGIAAMSKNDVDALVMHLLDKYSHQGGVPLQGYSNQVLSETLRAPVSKIKRLRYDSGLKYGGRVEDEAKRRFITCLSRAAMDLDTNKVVLIVEDVLAKNWIQGQIKESGLVFDGSFNSEIVKVKPDDFFKVLETLLDPHEVHTFKLKYESLAKKKKGQELVTGFGEILKSFVKGAVSAAGGVVATSLIGLPLVGS